MGRSVLSWVLAFTAVCAAAAADDQGWGYLMDKLVADGVSRERVQEAFQDTRLAPFTGLDFSLARRREGRAWYRRFLRPQSIAAARTCRARYGEAFERAERMHGVPASVLAAVLFVETGCGRNTGSHLIFTRLARLAMANAPENVERNLDRLARVDGTTDPAIEQQVRDRARYLERTFYPEVRALFAVARRLNVGVFAMRGSSAGAFGYPQFLPTSYLKDGMDADGDGRISLFEPDDAAASCAHYLVRHGWRSDLSRAERRAVIWQYNHSEAYADTILALAARIENQAPARPSVGARKAVRRRAAQRTRRQTQPRQTRGTHKVRG